MAEKSSRDAVEKGVKFLQRNLYKKIYKYGVRFVGRNVFISYIQNDDACLGITVTRKYGNAVKRNRFKRLARAAYAQVKIPSYACNIAPRGPCRPLKTQDVLTDLEALAHDLANAQQTATTSR